MLLVFYILFVLIFLLSQVIYSTLVEIRRAPVGLVWWQLEIIRPYDWNVGVRIRRISRPLITTLISIKRGFRPHITKLNFNQIVFFLFYLDLDFCYFLFSSQFCFSLLGMRGTVNLWQLNPNQVIRSNHRLNVTKVRRYTFGLRIWARWQNWIG